MNNANKKFQLVVDRFNENISKVRINNDITKPLFWSENGTYSYGLNNKVTGVFLGLQIYRIDEEETSSKHYLTQVHRIGNIPSQLLNEFTYRGAIFATVDSGPNSEHSKQFLNLLFNGNRIDGDKIGETRSKAAQIVQELSDLMGKKKSNHTDVLRAVDLSFRLLTFPDRDAVDLIGEIG